MNTNSIAMWETLPNNADSNTENRLQGVFFHIWKSYVCANKLDEKQPSVSHSLTVMCLDVCLRMDGIPALGLWDLFGY